MKQPALRSGVVSGETLVYQLEAQEIAVPLGSPAWYTWLEQAHSFSFRNDEGTFTAHKARASNRRGGWYWYAYRHRHGHVFRSYLGSSSRLTLERLRDAARQLALRSEMPAHEQLVTPYVPPELSPGSLERSQARFLATKCSIPRLPVHHIVRSRLISELNQGAQERLTLVSAPAGSGKTTLLAAWARTANLPVAWLSLEAAENDPPRFLSYLVATLARLDARLGERYDSMAAHGSSWEESLTSFVNTLAHVLTRDTVLILDDYHLITREPIHAALRFLIDHAPSRLRLFIGTRVDPPLPLARLRAHRQLSELRTEDLRFVSAEVQAFVNAMGLALSGEAKDLLEQRAEGWIAGIQLLLLALRGQADAAVFLRAFGSNHRFLLDYVSEEILAQQTPDIQRFLLRTCILERLCGPLCDSVTGESGGQAKLLALRRVNLFVNALDDTQIWYRYHPLFAESLRTHLHKQESALVPELYQRASLWYEQHQGAEEACEYAFLAADLPRAANLLAELVPHLVEQGRMEQLCTWWDQLPPALIAASPQLSAASIAMQGLRTQAPESMDQMLERMERQVQAQPQDAVSWVELQSELTLRHGLAAFSHNDFARAIALLHEALRSLSAQETALSRLISLRLRVMLSMAYRANGDLAAAEQLLLETSMPKPSETYDPLNLGAVWSLASLYEAQGQLRKRGALYERMFQALGPDADIPPLILALVQESKAALLYEWNRLPEASHMVQQALSLTERMGLAVFSVFSSSSLWTQARIDLAQGQVETARQHLERKAQPLVQMPLVEREEAPWAAARTRLALVCDQVEEAWQWTSTCGRRFDDRPGPELSGACYFEYLTLARILIARGRLQRNKSPLSQALFLLGHLRDLVVRLGLQGWFMEIQMLTALALQAQSKTRQALTTLGSVLAQAEPEGYVRLFADEGQPMAHLLAQVSSWTTASLGYIQQLQAATMQHALPERSQTEPRQPLPNPLSMREQEVLSLLAEGASNQQIADHLIISLNTAKRHVKHLLAKLAVTNRTQAVAHARELHLL